MSKARKAFALRIDPVLYEEMERWAQQEFRSVNGQIEYVLRAAVARRIGRSVVAADDSAGRNIDGDHQAAAGDA